jgi:hypothetical protein
MKKSIRPVAGLIGVALACWWFSVAGASGQQVKEKGAAAKVAGANKVAAPATVPAKGGLDARGLAGLIDRDIDSRLAAEKVKPSQPADDAEFLRRVYLDLIGVIPPPEKVSAFLKSSDPAKRAKVIDELLADPRFGTSLAETWSGMLLPRESNNRRLDHQPLQQWLAEGFNSNKPLDKLVYELITATGEQKDNGAVTYFVGNPTVDKITDNVTQMFLGVRLQCAQCHNHPFVEIKQADYWGMAAFFMKVRMTANPNMAAKKGISPGVFEAAGGARPKKKLPESAKIVPARFLQGETPKLDAKEPSRPVLASWITAPNNPYFAKAMVNRVWYQLFGRGIVNPVDDMHDGNVPSHPELLKSLTQQFKASGFDLKHLYRAICNSRAYQRTSRPLGDNSGDKEYYSHAAVRSLSPEQLYDSLVAVLGQPGGGQGPKLKMAMAGKKGAKGPRDAFLTFFRIEEGANPLEYQAGIPQALRLMNSPQTSGNAAVARLMKEGKGPAQVIEHLYLTALSRPPTPQEMNRMRTYVSRQTEARAGYSDILWALVNSSEFAFNH